MSRSFFKRKSQIIHASHIQIHISPYFFFPSIGYPVVTLGFGFKSYVSYKMRLRKQKEVQKENEFYMQLLQQALPPEQQMLQRPEKETEEGETHATQNTQRCQNSRQQSMQAARVSAGKCIIGILLDGCISAERFRSSRIMKQKSTKLLHTVSLRNDYL